MENTRQTWDEEASEIYRKAAPVAVPARNEQIATMIALAPFGTDESFRIVEIGSGEGILADAYLRAFPNARLLALDGSSSMLEEAGRRLADHGERFSTQWFDLLSDDWHELLDGVDLVVSSLVIHHLDDAGKRGLYRTVKTRVNDRAALLIADILMPSHPAVNAYFADSYDHEARRQSRAMSGGDGPYRYFLESEWNLFRYPDPEVDVPSRLFDQLRWLDEAGFVGIDCFWLRAGHGIFGGYSTQMEVQGQRIDFEAALGYARAALGDE